MENENVSGKSVAQPEETGFNAEDLAQIFDYPSIGQLFEDPDSGRIEVFRSRLKNTRENLERVIHYDTRDKPDRAEKPARAIKITPDFSTACKKCGSNKDKFSVYQ